MDCVRNDQDSEASANLSDLGSRFVPVIESGSWYPHAGYSWSKTFTATLDVQGVIRTLSNLGDSGVLVLGYPLWIYTGDTPESEPFLKPIFTYALEYEATAGGYRIWSDDPVADINLDWLSYAMKSEDKKRSFLTVAGLMERRGAEDQTGDGTGELLSPDFRSLSTAVTTFFGDQIREPLAPEALTRLSQDARPLTGIYNHAVLMSANRTRYAQSLLKDLGAIARCSDEELDQTALVSIFREGGVRRPDRSAAEIATRAARSVADTCELNSDQRTAIASMIHERLTIVTGPPGTGKSQVVASAIVNVRLKDQTVVFASRNHKAIDAVVHRPEMHTRDDLSLIARANDKEGWQSFGFEDAIKELLTSPHDEGARKSRSEKIKELEENIDERGELVERAERVVDLRDQLAEIESELSSLSAEWPDERREQLSSMPDQFPSKAVSALNYKVVRWADRTPALWEPIVSWLRGHRVRKAARRLNRKLVAARFSEWAFPIGSIDFDDRDRVVAHLKQLENASRFCESRLRQRPLEEEAPKLPSIDELLPRLEALNAELSQLSELCLGMDAAARQGLPPDEDRSELASLRVALQRLKNPLIAVNTRDQVQPALRRSLPKLLWHYPAWAVTNLSIGSRIPLVPGLFDLAIIDEASQCDIASAIPVLFRARRAGVVGDPCQLSHTTKLSRSRDNVICRRRGVTSLRDQRFSYPDTSLFDLFAQTNGVSPILLADHYRCAPAIAEYANRVFYGSRLRVLTTADRLRVPRGWKAGIHWTAVESELERRPTGCVSHAEVDECVCQLRRLLLDDAFHGTVGVVTPFREQRELLQQAIMSDVELAQAGMRASLVIHTAHGFQGDERDVMFMSLCAGPGMPAKSLGWLRKNGNLLNVAATRARAVLHVIGNRGWALRCAIPHIAGLAVDRPQGSRRTESEFEHFESVWEKRLYEALAERGLQPIPQYSILGRRLDLALIGDGKTPIDIEVDGARFHVEADGTRRRDDIWRDITLRGAGWRVMRFWVRDLRDRLPDCVRQIANAWRNE